MTGEQLMRFSVAPAVRPLARAVVAVLLLAWVLTALLALVVAVTGALDLQVQLQAAQLVLAERAPARPRATGAGSPD